MFPEALGVMTVRLKVALSDLLPLLVILGLVEPALDSVLKGRLCFGAGPAPIQVFALVRSLIAGAVLEMSDHIGELLGVRGGIGSELVIPLKGWAAVLGPDMVVQVESCFRAGSGGHDESESRFCEGFL